MRTITLEVSDSAAEKIDRMSPTEKKAIAETLNRLITSRKSLAQIMEEASEQARSNGLTPEILQELLKEE